jgi:sugar lactone lactonase YvrE
MTRLFRIFVIAAVLTLWQSATARAESVPVTITSLDPRFDQLVPKEAQLERIADGFTWVEGPVWDKQGGYLLFSDIPANAVYRWKPGESASLFLKNSGYSGTTPFAGKEPGSNGLALDADGQLVLCRHGDREIGRLEPLPRMEQSPYLSTISKLPMALPSRRMNGFSTSLMSIQDEQPGWRTM